MQMQTLLCKYVLHDNHSFVIVFIVYERLMLFVCVTIHTFDLMITKAMSKK